MLTRTNMEVGHEIVPDFLIPLVKNAHPAQKYSIVERKKRSESVPRDGVFPQAASQAIERLKVRFESLRRMGD